MSNLKHLSFFLRPVLVVLLAASVWAQATGPRRGPLPGGENAGGTGVWILPAAAMFSSPNYSYGAVYLENDSGQVFAAPRYAWVRVDNHLALFFDGAFIGADLHFFVQATQANETVDSRLVVVGRWARTE